MGISLTRSGDTTSSASVSFATNDGAGLTNCDVINHIASPRCDYENTIGTMTFAAGETSKTFSIAIVDDGYAEGNETFTIGLNSPSGATLGAQSTATVTIQDNEGVSNGVNPIDQTNFFVRQQYIDFLGREPDPPGFAGWTSTINNCSGDTTQCDRIHVSQLFFQSAEFQQRGYFVYRFYPVAFGRKPDYAEFVPDLASVSGFLSDAQLEAAKVAFIADFMARPAFVSAYSFPNTPTGNQQYVDALSEHGGRDVVAVAGDSAGADRWLEQLDADARRSAETDCRERGSLDEVQSSGVCGDGILWLSPAPTGRGLSRVDCRAGRKQRPTRHGHGVCELD